ncbi:hypothetical protein HPP92_005980 [Vanilla planifolia]|uniref:NAC domain-containing protein n=1 Tax=Vanilla planifolia TaxID=51239 RepID=A0A835RUP2_VANPL|nr:hypothetical protein HPP92_005980 [Vanilla planifolia]
MVHADGENTQNGCWLQCLLAVGFADAAVVVLLDVHVWGYVDESIEQEFVLWLTYAARPSWLVDSKRIAKKIKSASERDPRNIKWISNPTKACPRCNYVIDNTDVIQEWPGLPHGVKFDPTDQELLRHLVAKVGKSGVNPHPLINEFIPTVEEDDGICYTHPWKLPGD